MREPSGSLGQSSTDLSHHLVTDTKIVLVDPDRQRQAIEENDPQKLIKKTVDEHGKVTDEQFKASLKNAFKSAFFVLSEIVFDK